MPGPELDRLVQERVFGATTVQVWRNRVTGQFAAAPVGNREEWFVERAVQETDGRYSDVPKWSTHIVQTMLLVERFRRQQRRVTIVGDEWYAGGSWEVTIHDPTGAVVGRGIDEPGETEHREPSLSLAVCRAALACTVHKEKE